MSSQPTNHAEAVNEASAAYRLQAGKAALLRPGYKMTEVGVIPEDWSVKSVIEIGQIKTGPFGTLLKASEYSDNEGVPLISVGEVGEGSFCVTDRTPQIPKNVVRRLPQYVLRSGDIVFGRKGAVNRSALVSPAEDGWFLGSDGISIRPNNKCYPPYLAAQFQSRTVQSWLVQNAIGTTMPSLNQGILSRVLIPYASEVEQRAIAAALSDVDALLDGLERLIAKKRDLKQAAMQQLLTGQTRLPGFSGEWEVKRLGGLAELNRINVIPASRPDQLFVHFSLPAFDEEKGPQIEHGSAIGSNKFRVPPDAVMVSKLNPRIPRIWAPVNVPQNSCASTEWLVLTPREGIGRTFLYVICSSPAFYQQMALAATGTTGSHQRISPITALDILVSAPVDREEQTAIATILSDMDAELAALEARRDKTRALKQGMMQELLTGKTRLL
ncbi:restriction endonuclease subunit S [Methylomonas sp. UP202]|uniref:restriction endonuclease subunit S n=1 Tax=Methylomonas sp. UP202 TaxID=3040943 RepID=UPI00247B225F|nr:restriction endonuclease subunit S [Methylomonas sp. UP202]WGS84496.1 restriction endonuclease subunit S [Methylomonas sp. UP202]